MVHSKFFWLKYHRKGTFNSLMRDLRLQSGLENILHLTIDYITHDFENLLDPIV